MSRFMRHFAGCAGCLVLATWMVGCVPQSKPEPTTLRQELDEVSKAHIQQVMPAAFSVPMEVQQFCGNCHLVPQPTSFTREAWYDEIHKGFEFYARSGRQDLIPPNFEKVLNLYRQSAPATMRFQTPPEVDQAWLARFDQEPIRWRDGVTLSPAISSIKWIEAHAPSHSHLLVTDMRDGSINKILPKPKASSRELLGRARHPARAVMADLDQDGQQELLVAELGSFSPYDHTLGAVLRMEIESAKSSESSNGNKNKLEPLLAGLGRVADVAVDDFTGDNLPDLLVAEFGHRVTGGIHLLRNLGKEEKLEFHDELLDIRPGTIQVLPHDWNQDGDMDFAGLVSQEFECVDLFINRREKFDRHRAGSGTDLTYGSVGLSMADIDRDGDQDLIYVNGDCFDNNFANPSHGIQWLENQGQLNFTQHRLLEMPGAYRAVSVDVDGDQDLDIVAVANLPTIVYPETLVELNPISVVILEQVEGTQFRPHVLARGIPRYPALEVADFNGDGKVDLAVGTLLFDTDAAGSEAARLPHVTIWWQK